ncbi:MAG TPA: T9SS type A sorting domain-containing protein, partial [Bacteroidota bacterium]|nr:T9SS type A sorting domain-containing protein [Bacteroidota bacterium]
PRDSAYFADHLLFAKNYFQKASGGRQNISATVLGKVITVSRAMKQYAPLNSSNLPLAQFLEESWEDADSLYPTFPFQDYNLFVVFHAGSGKDIDLQGSIGYDPTPYDIPSLYFSLASLKNILGQSYAGIQLKNHPGVVITNSALLPETENRTLPASTGGDFLYQLGINGLIVSNVGSFLGLPDLFNTKTGATAIGRFGLMDGQAIFSFFGLFPPQPSAWEKMFLGWVSPILVPSGTSNLQIPASGSYHGGIDTVYRVPISADEYFLVENRNRDAHGDGVTLTIRWNGQQFQKKYTQDDNDFNAFNVDSIYGTVVDIDEPDWSLPGAQGYLGGILIWHIDEKVIDENFSSNTINADPNHRGVDLDEADGSQDIGQTYSIIDPGSGTEDGSPLDYWFARNISPVYKNEFSESTNPNSLSNSKAHSHVTINNFSDAGAVMTFQTTVGDSHISLLKTFKRPSIKLSQNDAPLFADIDGDGSRELIFTSGDSIYVFRHDLTPLLSDPSGLFSPFGGKFQPCLASTGLACSNDSSLVILSPTDANGDHDADPLAVAPVGAYITSPVTSSVSGDAHYYAGDANGFLDEFVGLGISPSGRTRIASSPVTSLSVTPSRTWTGISTDTIGNSSGSIAGTNGKKILAIANVKFTVPSGTSTGFAGVSTVALFDDNTFSIYDGAGLNGAATYHVEANVTGSFALADLNGDGRIDILVGTDNGLYAFNDNGVLLEGFPLKTSDGGKVAGSPIVVGLSGGSGLGILFGSTNGQVYGYSSDGKSLAGFPVQTGGIVSSLAFSGDLLAASSTDSSVYVWKVDGLFDSTKVVWGGFLADEFHSNYIESSAPLASKSTDLLPSTFAYNWPNPVYTKTTHIRYFLGKPAAVTIKIFNMAGELVEQFSGPGVANLDNEVEWDVSKVQSGVYFVQIRAAASGEEKSVVIKIAVVK